MYIAEFEKVSKKQFDQDCLKLNTQELNYEDIKMPTRATKGSAGYDFYTPMAFNLKPGETIKIPTGIRCKIEDGYVLKLYPRSSLGFKYQITLLNTVGIIDSDYYDAENEGHIIIGLVNRGKKEVSIDKDDRIVQGIFEAYFLAKEEEVNILRKGGFGSTN